VNTTSRHLLRTAALVLVLGLAPSLHAEKTDKEKPINFTSDDGQVNYEKRTGVLKGNVVITQGTLTIKANRIDFTQNPDNSLSAIAYGTPVTFRQKRDGTDEYYEGWAQRAEYDGSKEFLELFDNAVLKKGTDEIHSNYISYNSATEFFKAEGRPSANPVPDALGRDDRVRGSFMPKGEGAPGKPDAKNKDKDKGTAAKDKAAAAKAAPGLSLQPSGELAPAK
jgi:lipopolysaccharide export system protein LptA